MLISLEAERKEFVAGGKNFERSQIDRFQAVSLGNGFDIQVGLA